MSFEYNKITQAQNRPMTSQEQFGLVIFVVQFFFSKFGIFVFFLSLNILPSFFQNSSSSMGFERSTRTKNFNQQISISGEAAQQKNLSAAVAKEKTSSRAVQKLEGCQEVPREQFKPQTQPLENVLLTEVPKINQFDQSKDNSDEQQDISQKNSGADGENILFPLPYKDNFQKIKNYCIIATIVTLFLNPQQTKYFGDQEAPALFRT